MPLHDQLYRGRGDGTFEDVTLAAGLRPAEAGFGLGAMPLDFDLDGDTDLYVANDSTPNFLWANGGDGTFRELGLRSGVSHDTNGKEQARLVRTMFPKGVVTLRPDDREGTDVDAGLAAIQSRVRSFDPEIAVSELAGYPALLRESVAGTRLLAILLGIFAGSALLLGCVGVYGIVAFSVREREGWAARWWQKAVCRTCALGPT